MSPADDDSQQQASSEAPSTSPLEGAKGSASLPQLEVIGAAAETSESDDGPGHGTSNKPLSARERLNSRTREARPRKKRGRLIAAIVLLVLLLGIIAAVIGGFAYLRWYEHDDALDFQGTWYVAGTETPIEITADAIQLTESVAYHYKLNTHDKTITLTLGNMTGYGSYRFSLDRTQLVIFDGQTDPNTILESDIRWLVEALYDELMDEPNDVTAGIRRNRTLLTREPNTLPVSTLPSGTESSSATSNDSEGPHTVWSAEEWLGRGSNSDENDSDNAADTTGTPNTTSNANDVDSLFQGISDLPAEETPAPEEPVANEPESAAS